jgi:hypothetical protein
VLFMLSSTTSYTVSYFLPLMYGAVPSCLLLTSTNTGHSLRNSLGFSDVASQCLSALTYVFAAFIKAFQVGSAVNTASALPLIMINSLFGVCSLALLSFHHSSARCDFGVFLLSLIPMLLFPLSSRTEPRISVNSGQGRCLY